MMEEENKHKMELEVEKEEQAKPSKSPAMVERISRFENLELPRNLEDNCHSKNKPKVITEVEKSKKKINNPKWSQASPGQSDSVIKKKVNKLKSLIPIISSNKNQHKNSEAAQDKQNRQDKPSQVSKTKKKSPTTKVKTEAVRELLLKSDSPKLLTRMKPPKKANNGAL